MSAHDILYMNVCIDCSSESKVARCTILIGNRSYLMLLPMLKETVNNDCDLKRLCHTVPSSVAEKGHCFIDDDGVDDDAAVSYSNKKQR